MRPITLNLASRPFRNNTLVAAVLGFVGASLVGMTAYNLYVYMGYGSAYARLQQDQANDRAKIAKLLVEERRLSDEVRARDFRRAYERGKLASELVRKSAFSWTRLFNTLETVVPPDVITTAIRPNIGADEIDLRIEGVAKSSGAFLTLQERLMQSPWFTRVFPGSERRLNPNLPDISFLLTCNYLPEGKASPATVAGGETTAPATEAGAGGGDAATGGAAAAAVAEKAPDGQPPESVAPAGGDAKKGAAAAESGPVGRDGRPLAERASLTLLAPGAVQMGEIADAPAGAKQGARPGAKADGRKKATSPVAAPPSSPPARAGVPPAKQGVTPATKNTPPATAAPSSGAGAAHETPDPLPAKPDTTNTSPVHSGPLNRVDATGRVWDPNQARTAPPLQQAARAAQPKPPEIPATAERLDLPLSFTATPVGTIYDRLAAAHGVKFRIDPGVDRSQPISVNLQGRRLEDALALVAGVARHRVRRVADGSYTVVAVGADGALADAPVAEEPLAEGAP